MAMGECLDAFIGGLVCSGAATQINGNAAEQATMFGQMVGQQVGIRPRGGLA